jgi:hypothetical protein
MRQYPNPEWRLLKNTDLNDEVWMYQLETAGDRRTMTGHDVLGREEADWGRGIDSRDVATALVGEGFVA